MKDQSQVYGQISATDSSVSQIKYADQSQLQTIQEEDREGRLSTTQERPDRVRSHLANLPPRASTNHPARFSTAKSFDLPPSTTPPPTEWGQYFKARSARIRKERELKAASMHNQCGKYWNALLQEYRGVPPLHQETEGDRRQSEIMRLKTQSLMESRSNGGSGKRFRFWGR